MNKNIILIFVLLIAPLHAMAQYPDWEHSPPDIKQKPSWNEVNGSFVMCGGYNFLEKTPISGVGLCCDIGYIRLNTELVWSYISHEENNNHFYYVAFSVGPIIGKRTKFYAQLGGITWGGYTQESFYSDIWRIRVQLGSDIYLSKKVYLNVNTDYVLPYRNPNFTYSELLSLQLGLGFRF